MFFRLLAVGAAGLLAAAPATGQDLLCCGMMIPFKGSWIGMSPQCSRELAKASEEQVAQACQVLNKLDEVCEDAKAWCAICDQALLDRLRGRMGGLNEARAAHQKSAYDSQQKRNGARDRLWGKGEGLKFEGGSISAFGQASLDSLVLASGGGGRTGKAYSDVRKKYRDARDWAEKAWTLGSDPGAVENWGALGEKLLGEQADATFEKRSAEAVRAATEHLQKTGSLAGAQGVYRQTWGGYGRLQNFQKTADKLTGALDKLRKLYETGDKAANDLQDWIDAYRDNEGAKRDMDKVQSEVDRTQAEIDRIMAACAASGASGGASAEAGAQRLQRAQQALAALRAFQKALGEADARLGAQVLAPFSPWLTGTWRAADPRLLAALAKAARPDLERFDRTLADLEKRAALARSRLLAIPPDLGK